MRNDARSLLCDRRVPRIGLGIARLSLLDVPDSASAEAHIDHALELGIRYLDTARAYTTRDHSSHSEALVARAIARRQATDTVVIATKGGHYRSGDTWPIDATPHALRADCTASLAWLKVDRIDLYYLHHPDPRVPLEESMGALDDLRREGLIGAVGICNVTPDQLEIALQSAPITAVQNPLSPYDTSSDAVLARCRELGITFVAYSPLGGTTRSVPIDRLSATANDRAQELGVEVESVILAWVLDRLGNGIALTGASRSRSLRSSIAALEITLATDERAAITAEITLARAAAR
jgi:aryl-alcohol dehydrogenase-like predicted oxidoreductase